MLEKKKISANSIVLFCLIGVYYCLNAKYLNFSLFIIMRWVFPALLVGIAVWQNNGRIVAPPWLMIWFSVAVLVPSIVGADATTSIIKYISWVLIFYGSYIYFYQNQEREAMHRSLEILCFILVFFQIANVIFTLAENSAVNGRSTGMTTNANTLGIYSNLAFWAGVFFYTRTINKTTKLIWLGFCLTTAYTAIASGSRTAFLVMALNFMAFLFLLQSKRKHILLFAASLTLLIYLVLSGKLNFLGITAVERLSEEGGAERAELWDFALNLWQNNKLFGVGYTISSRYNELVGLAFHNSYISYLVECGIWGVVLFAPSLVYVLFKCFSHSKRQHLEFYIACMMLVVLLIAAWSESFMFAVGSTEGFTFWFLLAWAMVYIKGTEKKISSALQ